MLKKFDIYIIKKYLATFFVSIVLLILLIIVIDLTEKLSRYIDEKIPINEIIDYYLSMVPFFVNLFMPLFIFISIIFFTSKLAAKSEVIAILSSGVSFWRFAYPYILTSLFFTAFSFYLSNFIIPQANKTMIRFENIYINRGVERDARNIHRQIASGTFVYIRFLDRNNIIGHFFSLEKFEGSKLVSKLWSDNIAWDSIKGKWIVNNYCLRVIGDKRDTFETGLTKELDIPLKPKHLTETVVDIATLNIYHLNKFIEEQKLLGNKYINEFIIEREKRFAIPFSTIILALIGVLLSSKKIRGGTGLNLGIGIVLSLVYLLLQKLSDNWANIGSMPIVLAVWLPNMIYVPVLFVLYFKYAPK